MRTKLRFDNGSTYELNEQAATAFAGYSTPTGWSYRAMFGALLDGGLEPGTHDFDPGFVVGLGVTRQWKLGDGQWFVTGSAGLSVARASTQMSGVGGDAGFTAADARGGVIAGRTFGEAWSPYVLARGFGGPVWWSVDGDEVSGSDTRHFQVGAGLSIVLSAIGATLNLDVSALGEQAVSIGATKRL